MKTAGTTFTRALELAVLAHPAGISSGDASRHAGYPATVERMRASALLNQQWHRGKMDRQGTGRSIRYFPNSVTGIDRRSHRPTRTAPSAHERRAAAQRARAATRDLARQKRQANTPKPAPPTKPPKASAAQVARVSALFVKPTRLKCTDHAETVDEFLARGGQIERLPSGACSRPLASFGDDEPTSL